jgi:hypothetical protein
MHYYHNYTKESDYVMLHNAKSVMLDIISDLDTLLATNEAFLFGKWVKSARAQTSDAKL